MKTNMFERREKFTDFIKKILFETGYDTIWNSKSLLTVLSQSEFSTFSEYKEFSIGCSAGLPSIIQRALSKNSYEDSERFILEVTLKLDNYGVEKPQACLIIELFTALFPELLHIDAILMCEIGEEISRRKSDIKDEGLLFIQKAAINGIAKAQYLLYNRYYEETEQAFTWLEESAKNGYSKAQTDLGWCYINGEETAKDKEKGLFWLKRAAQQNNPEALYILGLLYCGDVFEFDEEIVKYDMELGMKLLHRAAEQGNGLACWYLGYKETNPQMAAQYYLRGAALGDPLSQYYISQCYLYESGVERDVSKAFKWCSESAESGCSLAQNLLGVMYQLGIGCNKSISKAIEWYTKAVENGNENAKKALEDIYKVL